MNRQAKLKTLSGAMLLLCAVITVTQLPSNIRYLRFACSPAGSGISVPQAVSELVFAVLFAAAFAVTGFALIKKRSDLRLISISFIASGALQLVNSAVTAAFAPHATAAAWLIAIMRALLGAAGFAAVAAAARPKMRRPLPALLLSLPAALYLFTWLIQLPGTYIAVEAQYRHLMRTFVSGAAFNILQGAACIFAAAFCSNLPFSRRLRPLGITGIAAACVAVVCAAVISLCFSTFYRMFPPEALCTLLTIFGYAAAAASLLLPLAVFPCRAPSAGSSAKPH